MPDLRIPMIHEAPDAWKIDVPDSVDGPKLKANVMKHLTAVAGDKAKWPAEKTQAYQLVSHHMLAAVLGQE